MICDKKKRAKRIFLIYILYVNVCVKTKELRRGKKIVIIKKSTLILASIKVDVIRMAGLGGKMGASLCLDNYTSNTKAFSF